MRAWWGFAAVAFVVLAYEVAAVLTGGELMTTATRRWWHSHGWPQWVMVVVVIFLLAHLVGTWGESDPLDRLYGWLSKR